MGNRDVKNARILRAARGNPQLYLLQSLLNMAREAAAIYAFLN